MVLCVDQLIKNNFVDRGQYVVLVLYPPHHISRLVRARIYFKHLLLHQITPLSGILIDVRQMLIQFPGHYK